MAPLTLVALLPWKKIVPWVLIGAVILVIVAHYRGVRAERAELRDLAEQQRIEIEAMEKEMRATKAALVIAEQVIAERAVSRERITTIRRDADASPDEDDGEVAPVLERTLRALDRLRDED